MMRLISLCFGLCLSLCFIGWLTAGLALASAKLELDPVAIDLSDQAALQSGAKYFVNYCIGCHSLKFHRYESLVKDLGISEAQLKAQFLVGSQVSTDPITNTMPAADAEKWFGAPPPDLSVIARSRGADWLYTFLRGFYLDDSRPFGVNNQAFELVGMPHVLWRLQGWQERVEVTEVDAEGHEHLTQRLELINDPKKAGTMSPAEFDQAVRELVTFLTYVGEPALLVRKKIGVAVLLFLAVLAIVAYFLKREFWRDVH